MRTHSPLLVVSMLVAVPLPAQFYPAPGPKSRPAHSSVPDSSGATGATGPVLGQVYRDIDEGARHGQLSHQQAKGLRREAREIGALEERYAIDGLTDSEAAELQNRVEVLKSLTDAKRSGVVK